MKYSTKVNKCKPFLSTLEGMKEGSRIAFQYNGKPYTLHAYKSYNGEMSYSVWDSGRGMNVGKVGLTSLSLYTFDMMSQKTTYRMDVLKCSIVEGTDDAMKAA